MCRPATAEGDQPRPFTVEYFDSLQQPSLPALVQAEATLRVMAHLLQPAHLDQPAQLRVASSRRQSDGWSCGFWVMLWCEQFYRLARGEGARLVEADWPEKRKNINSFLQSLMHFKEPRDKKTAPSLEPDSLQP
eukprot:11857465-Heterocapsa_arctica.AAC.1